MKRCQVSLCLSGSRRLLGRRLDGQENLVETSKFPFSIMFNDERGKREKEEEGGERRRRRRRTDDGTDLVVNGSTMMGSDFALQLRNITYST